MNVFSFHSSLPLLFYSVSRRPVLFYVLNGRRAKDSLYTISCLGSEVVVGRGIARGGIAGGGIAGGGIVGGGITGEGVANTRTQGGGISGRICNFHIR